MCSYKCYEQSFYNLRISIYEGTFNETQYLVTFSHRMSDVISDLQFIVSPDFQVFFFGTTARRT